MTLVTSSAPTRLRDVLAAATLWLPVLAVGITWLLWQERLPADLPQQWGSDGRVSSTGPTGATAIFAAGVSLTAAIVATYFLRERAAPNRRMVYLGLGFAAGLSSCVWLTSAGVTIAAGTGDPALGAWILLTFVSFGYGLPAFFLAHRWVAPARADGGVPAGVDAEAKTPIEAGDVIAPWTETVTSPALVVITAAGVLGEVAALLSLLGDDVQNSLVLIVTMSIVGVLFVLLLGFIRVQVSVDHRGLRVTSWVFGIRLKQVALDQIELAFAGSVSLMQSGGWGYRLMSGRTAVVLRGGPAVTVNLRSGNQFAVTVADPDGAAAQLNALCRRIP